MPPPIPKRNPPQQDPHASNKAVLRASLATLPVLAAGYLFNLFVLTAAMPGGSNPSVGLIMFAVWLLATFSMTLTVVPLAVARIAVKCGVGGWRLWTMLLIASTLALFGYMMAAWQAFD